MKGTRILLTAVIVIAVGIVAGGMALSSARSPAVAPNMVGVFYTAGMTCGSCAKKIDAALKETGAVAAVEVDVEGGRFIASFDSQKIQPQAIAQNVTSLGYKTSVAAVMTIDQFQAVSGRALGGTAAKAASGGCGGGCCNKR